MQETRQQILAILKQRGEATVDDVVHDLESQRGSITSVTVRHHLTKLQNDGLVNPPEIRHRAKPGRPQHVYTLSERGIAHFPNNYQNLAASLLQQVQQTLPDSQVNVIIDNVADTMAHGTTLPQGTMRDRLNAVVAYLDELGYEARWETHNDGYLLHTSNCPYHHIAQENDVLCQMDMRLIARMLGALPRLVSRVVDGDNTCSYLVPGKL